MCSLSSLSLAIFNIMNWQENQALSKTLYVNIVELLIANKITPQTLDENLNTQTNVFLKTSLNNLASLPQAHLAAPAPTQQFAENAVSGSETNDTHNASALPSFRPATLNWRSPNAQVSPSTLKIAQDTTLAAAGSALLMEINDIYWNCGLQLPPPLQAAQQKHKQLLKECQLIPIEDSGPSNPSRQRIVSSLPTDNPALDLVIHKTVRLGYVHNGAIVRPQEVVVYKYCQSTPASANVTPSTAV